MLWTNAADWLLQGWGNITAATRNVRHVACEAHEAAVRHTSLVAAARGPHIYYSKHLSVILCVRRIVIPCDLGFGTTISTNELLKHLVWHWRLTKREAHRAVLAAQRTKFERQRLPMRSKRLLQPALPLLHAC